MANMSTAEVNAYLAKQFADQRKGATATGTDNSNHAHDESLLHNQIIAECKRRGWIYFHGSMAMATARTRGEPDFQILADGGRYFLIECKSSAGKLTTEQLGMQAWAARLQHTIHVCRSFTEFIALVGPGLVTP